MAKQKSESQQGAPDGWAQLQTLLADSKAHSVPGITLVLGAGIHRERTSNSIANWSAVNALGSWRGLLSHFATSQSLKCDPQKGNLALVWEELAFKFGGSGPAWQREKSALNALQKVIIGRFLIDELIKEEVRRVWRPQPSHTKRGSDLVKSRAFCSDLDCRKVWQPHGNVLLKDSLCLGSRAYMLSMMAFEKYRNEIWKVNRQQKSKIDSNGKTPSPRPAKSYLSWADAMLHSHLLFVGCGLSSHDADIWFALNCRRRYWIRNPGKAPQTFVVRVYDKNADPIPNEYAKVLSANNYDEAWKLLGWTLEGRKRGK